MSVTGHTPGLRHPEDFYATPAWCTRAILPHLGSLDGAPWLRANTPSVYVLPKRPSFTGGKKTDATDYAWMVWSDAPTKVVILDVEPALLNEPLEAE